MENHPNPTDNANGTYLNDEAPDTIVVLTWTGYSSGTGLYNAISTRWHIDEQKQEIVFSHLDLKQGYNPWTDMFTNMRAMIPDSHKRAVRAWACEHWGMKRFRSLTVV